MSTPTVEELHKELQRLKSVLGAAVGVDLRNDEERQAALDAEADAEQEDVEATDAAQTRADELGVDITLVEGTGVDGRVLVADVEAAAAQ